MKRRLTVTLALVCSLAVVTAPVAASDGLAVASNHTTSTDFNNADTLTNLTISGSGSAAYVTLPNDRFESFEDGIGGYSGDTGGFSTTTSKSTEGSTSLRGDSTGGAVDIANADFATSQGQSITVDMQIDNGDDNFAFYYAAQNESGKPAGYRVSIRGDANGHDDLAIMQGEDVSNGQVLATSSFNPESYTNEWLQLNVTWENGGTMTADLDDSNGNDITEVSTTDQTHTSGHIGFGLSQVGGDVDNPTAYWDNVTIGGGGSDKGTYISQNHSAEQIEQGFTNLTLENASANVRWEYNTSNGWEVANSSTYTATANHTLDLSGHSSRDIWRVNVTFDNESGVTTAELHDEGVEFTPDDPSVSNVQPADGTQLSDAGINMSFDLSDGDLATTQSDSLTLDWFVDGSKVNTKTVASNGTYNYTESGLNGGDHTYHIEVGDDYGHQTSSNTRDFKVPDTLTIHNESAPDQKLTSVSATVRFFGDGTIVERSSSQGEINLTGLPVTQDMTVVAEADGYVTRATFIESIYEQQRVYLLNDTVEPTANIVFELDDKTGEFPDQSTTLKVRRGLSRDRDNDGTDEIEFETVSGDVFGASGQFATTLVSNNTRYNLVVENEDGDVRELGSYTVTGDDVAQLEVGSIKFSGGQVKEGVAFAGALQKNNGNKFVKLSYRDPNERTEYFVYNVTNTSSGATLSSGNSTGQYGTFSKTISVPASAPDDVGYTINWTAKLTDGTEISGQTFVGDVPEIAKSLGLDPTVLAYMSYIFIAAITGLVVIFDDRLAALTGTATATALTLIGAVSIPPLALGIAGTVSVLFNVGRIR